MELYEQILCEAIAREVIPSLLIEPEKLLELKCHQTILKIWEVLENEDLEDKECFFRIEQIVCAMDELGIGAGGRHDF